MRHSRVAAGKGRLVKAALPAVAVSLLLPLSLSLYLSLAL